MRSFVDLGLFLSAIAVGIGTFLPVVGGVRATEIPLASLRDGFEGGDLSALAGPDLPLHLSLALPLAAAAILLLVAALFDSVAAAWAGAILGTAVVVVLAVRVQQSFGEYIRDNHSTVLTNQNGFVLLLSGTVVALLCGLLSVRRPTAQSGV
ncbi:hypothetical protein M1M07_06045 [Rhodococcus sp. HM1]|uniref:hypothetical protein n=1 Tax=unclassified Rhodococcus (in: high G+C Gram-positive bacteria) TaxID=192944 RepID=UPI0018CD583B|nr:MULTISPECIES: hypothetical protein [unclassified Rhodococcus (in: high G+C Gram-positive bacteria)]MBH0121302.1 hypothetical protein [Rhodococcus sp. CX]MCK8670674.1 hypothetical protein [Rhodococcus sp. HM1]